jgi:hypothetical protein
MKNNGYEFDRLHDNHIIRDVEMLKVVHFRERYAVDHAPWLIDRVTTFLYKRNRDLVTFSTAVTRPGDQFCKATGRHIALERYLNGEVVRVPVTNFFNMVAQ